MTTALTRGWSGTSEPCRGVAQPFVQRHARLPPEHPLGQGDVGLALRGVVDRQWLVDDLRRRTGYLEHLLRQLENRELVGVADVHRPDVVAVEQGENPPDLVVDVTEAAGLLAL